MAKSKKALRREAYHCRKCGAMFDNEASAESCYDAHLDVEDLHIVSIIQEEEDLAFLEGKHFPKAILVSNGVRTEPYMLSRIVSRSNVEHVSKDSSKHVELGRRNS